ncbi:uncharacterized protein ACN427_002294 isoform 2-T3 [Glossina fuscipes fuscipes]
MVYFSVVWYMKIYTNEGNPFGLKLQILAKLAKCEVTVEKIGINDDKTKNLLLLPRLESDSGLMLFSTNAAVKYFFPDEGEKRDEWLEWSVGHLKGSLFEIFKRFKSYTIYSTSFISNTYNQVQQKLQQQPAGGVNTTSTGAQATPRISVPTPPIAPANLFLPTFVPTQTANNTIQAAVNPASCFKQCSQVILKSAIC